RDHMQHAVHIDTGHTPVQGVKTFHDVAPVGKVPCKVSIGTQERHPWPVRNTGELKYSSNRERFGPSFVLRPFRTCVPPHMVHSNSAFMLGGEWINS
ncbi:MAG: hypothetical protein Q8Q84_15620, partial [Hydrogenophaga sp.]|nr:hypothetical protein [Hydrogenophaga sp.]